MSKMLRMFLTGTMILTIMTACGRNSAARPGTDNPAGTSTVTAAESVTPATDPGTESEREESPVFDPAKIPPLTKQQKYIRDSRDYGVVGFMLAQDPFIGEPEVFVGIDMTASADLRISGDTGVSGNIIWETADGSITGLTRSDIGLEFRVTGDETLRNGGHVSLSFTAPQVYEGTPEAIASVNGDDAVLQDGNYVVTDAGDGKYQLYYIYRAYDYDINGKYYCKRFFLQNIDSPEEASGIIARYREILTIGYLPDGDAAPIGENGEEIDLLRYRDFRNIEMQALNQYALYLDDASYLNSRAHIRIKAPDNTVLFSGAVGIYDNADPAEKYEEIQFAGNTWRLFRGDGYIVLRTPVTVTDFLELTVYSGPDITNVDDLSDADIAEMLATVFSPDRHLQTVVQAS